MLVFGWRWMFVLMAVLGFILAGIWYLCIGISIAKRSPRWIGTICITRAWFPRRTGACHGLGRLFQLPEYWGLVLGFFGNVYIGWLFAAWLPGYLEQQRHMSIAKTGFVASVPFLFGLVGSILGGYLADRLTARGMTAIASRKILTVIGLVIMACATFVAAETDSNFIAVRRFRRRSSSARVPRARRGHSPRTPPNYAASLGAIMDFGGFIGGALAPMVTGFMVQATGSFTPALLVAGAIGLCSAVAYRRCPTMSESGGRAEGRVRTGWIPARTREQLKSADGRPSSNSRAVCRGWSRPE